MTKNNNCAQRYLTIAFLILVNIFCVSLVGHSQNIFFEDFNQLNGDQTGNDNINNVPWTVSCPTCETGTGDHASVENELLEANNTDGVATWETENIDAGSCASIQISFDISESGTLEACNEGCNAVDWVSLEYSVNNGPWINSPDASFCGGECAEVYALYADDIPGGSDHYESTCINGGGNIRLRIRMQCWAAEEFWRIDNITVSCGQGPNLLITTPEAVCAPNTVDLTAAQITSGSEAGMLSYWTSAALTSQLPNPTNINTSGTYYILSQGADGCASLEAVDVTINPAPTVDAGNDISVCEGEPVVLLASGADLFEWSNGVTNGDAFNPGIGSQTISVIGTTNGCSDEDEIVINVTSNPILETVDYEVCSGGTIQLQVSGAEDYTWSPGTFLSSIVGTSVNCTPNTDITYQVTGTNINGCSSTIDVNVSINTTSLINAGEDISICTGDAAMLNASGGGSYSWGAPINSTLANPTVTPVSTTTYQLSGTDMNGCVGSDEVVVTVIDNPIVDAGEDQAICFGDEITLSGTGADTYTWTNGVEDGEILIPTVSATYTVTGFIGSCFATDDVTITVNDLPTVDAGPDQQVCEGTPIILTGSGVNLNWDNGVSNGVGFIQEPGSVVYTLTSIDANSCTNTDQVSVTVTVGPTISAGEDVYVCPGSELVLSGSGGSTYTWNNGVSDNVPFTAPSTNTTYTVIGTDGFGCSGTDNVEVFIAAIPEVTFDGTNLFGCSPLVVSLSNTTTEPTSSCQWQVGENIYADNCDAELVISSSGVFDVSLTITSENGCTATLTKEDYITVLPSPDANFYTSVSGISELERLVSFSNASLNADQYLWDFGDGQISVLENPDHEYGIDEMSDHVITLIAYNSFDCTDTLRRTIPYQEEVIYYIPNTFTPDGDEYNHVFRPILSSGIDAYNFNMQIYNRWGELIYESNDPSSGWDGSFYNNATIEVESGIYVWKIQFKVANNDDMRVLTGHVNLLR